MKDRVIALVLAATLCLALSAPVALAEGETAGTTPETAAEASPDAAQPEQAAADTQEAAPTEEIAAEAAAAEESTAAEPAPAEDAEGTLSFENIRARMEANNYSMRAVQESIDDLENRDYTWRQESLRLAINEFAAYQASIPGGSALSSQYEALRDQLAAIRDGDVQKEDAEAVRQYRHTQDLMVLGAETLYISVVAASEGSAALARKAAALERSIEALHVNRRSGFVSDLAVQSAEDGRTQLLSSQKTLQMQTETMLLQLKSTVGVELGAPLQLGALPKVTAEQLSAMDLDADLARAMETSYDLYSTHKQTTDYKKNTYATLIGTYGDNSPRFEVSQAKHMLQTLIYNEESTRQSYELKFRTLFAQVRDDAQKLQAAKSALALEEKNYAVAALQYKQGTISKNALADAADKLSDAKDAVSSGERTLFTDYHSYCWAVEYGVMN